MVAAFAVLATATKLERSPPVRRTQTVPGTVVG
jgi:hypothetical protein